MYVCAWRSGSTMTLTRITLSENVPFFLSVRRHFVADHTTLLRNLMCIWDVYMRRHHTNPSLFFSASLDGSFFLDLLVQGSLRVRSWSLHCLSVIMIGGRVSFWPCSVKKVTEQDGGVCVWGWERKQDCVLFVICQTRRSDVRIMQRS